MQGHLDSATQEEPQAAQSRERTVASLEAEIRRLNAGLAALEREKADVEAFAALAAHELLVPLVLADAYATNVSDRLDEEHHAESRQDLDALRRAGARARLLIEALLQDARSNGRELQRRPIDLNLLLDECLTLLAPEIDARGTHLQVAELPEVSGQEPMISSLFTNLLLNALKYGPRERGTILVDANRDAAGWRFIVQSQGPTIPVADRERIFEPYHRGRGERRARGAGLGLTLCRQIVERHGGRIGVTATVGGENLVCFTLPA
ncbi:MAG: ATP-binding protein [Solirubrobacteraceae bacterium]